MPAALVPVLAPGTRIYQRDVSDGHLSAFVSRESEGWHLSISHRLTVLDPITGKPAPGRYPTWDEIRDARYDLLPDDCTMAVLLPPKDQYVNLHPTAFHLFQIR